MEEGTKHFDPQGANSLPDLIWKQLGGLDSDEFVNYSSDPAVAFSCKEFLQTTLEFAAGLQQLGINRASSVGIIADSSPWWLMSDLALQLIGAVSVPMFANISPENLEFELEDSGAQWILCHQAQNLPQPLLDILQKHTIIALPPFETNSPSGPHFDKIVQQGKEHLANHPDFLQSHLDQLHQETIFSIVYTSGSTGSPKGVMLCHRNFLHQISGMQERFPLKDGERVLSVLPLAHIFQRTISFYFALSSCKTWFIDDVQQTAARIPSIKPHLLTVVPHLLEKIFAGMQRKAALKPFPLNLIALSGLKWAPNGTQEQKFQHLLWDKLVFGKIRSALGGNLRLMVSGGSPLHPDLNRTFENMGLPLYQGYGMTEHAPVISANFPGHNRYGSVGQAFPGVKIRIAKDGEVLVQSPSVMLGYHNDPEFSAEILEDGWLHTGDLGNLDDDGYLFLQGRKKDLLKTSTGKYVSPLPLEMALTRSRLIDHALIIADNHPCVSALVFVDDQNLPKGIQPNSKALEAIIQRRIRRLNKHLNDWEKIRHFKVIHQAPSVLNRMLTPTLKLRRDYIEEHFAEPIAEMYNE